MTSSPPSEVPRRPQKSAMLVAQRIVRDVVARGLRPGDHLPAERAMLDTYQTGRATLREALRLLEYQGVLRLKPGPGGGPVLQDPDAAHFGDALSLLLQLRGERFRSILEVRSAMEPTICRLAAIRIGEDNLRILDDTITAMGEHLDDQRSFFEINKRFHDTIAWSSGNAVFGYLIDSLLGIIDGTSIGMNYTIGRRAAVLRAHVTILAALRESDPAQAEMEMRRHIKEYEDYTKAKYPEMLDRVIEWERDH